MFISSSCPLDLLLATFSQMSVNLRYISGRFVSLLAKFGLKMGVFKGLNISKNNSSFCVKIGSYLIQIEIILHTKSRTLLNVRLFHLWHTVSDNTPFFTTSRCCMVVMLQLSSPMTSARLTSLNFSITRTRIIIRLFEIYKKDLN